MSNIIQSENFNAYLYRSDQVESSYNDKIRSIELAFNSITISFTIDNTLENALYQLISCKRVYLEIVDNDSNIIFTLSNKNIVFQNYTIKMSYESKGNNMILNIMYIFE